MPRSSEPVETGSSCVAETRAELDRLNAFRTPEGQAALALAAILDSGRSVMAAAANAAQMQKLLESLRSAAPKPMSKVDELKAARDKRRTTA